MEECLDLGGDHRLAAAREQERRDDHGDDSGDVEDALSEEIRHVGHRDGERYFEERIVEGSSDPVEREHACSQPDYDAQRNDPRELTRGDAQHRCGRARDAEHEHAVKEGEEHDGRTVVEERFPLDQRCQALARAHLLEHGDDGDGIRGADERAEHEACGPRPVPGEGEFRQGCREQRCYEEAGDGQRRCLGKRPLEQVDLEVISRLEDEGRDQQEEDQVRIELGDQGEGRAEYLERTHEELLARQRAQDEPRHEKRDGVGYVRPFEEAARSRPHDQRGDREDEKQHASLLFHDDVVSRRLPCVYGLTSLPLLICL